MTGPRYVTIGFRISLEEYDQMVDAMTPEMKQQSRADFFRNAINTYIGKQVFFTADRDVWRRP